MRKLLCAATGCCLALALAAYVLPESAWPAAAAVSAGCAAASLLLPRGKRGRAAVALTAACVAFLWSWGYIKLFVVPAEGLAGEEKTVSALVCDYPVYDDEYTRLTLCLNESELPSAKMYVYDYDAREYELAPGDKIRIPLRFVSAEKQYGEKSYYYIARGVQLRAYVCGECEAVGRWQMSFLYLPKALAKAIADKTLELFPDGTDGFMCALLTGGKDELYSDGGYTYLQIAGLSHVVAVSGMHLSFLMGAVRLITGRRRKTAFICVPITLIFMAMTGFTPSVVRAGVMLLVMLVAPLLRRENDPLTALGAAALMLLAVNPFSIVLAGLQLSFAAMLGLILFSGAIDKRLRGAELKLGSKRLRLPKYVSGTIASSIAAGIFTTPLSALHFGFVPVYSILANLLCLWAVSAAFILGYLCCIVGFALPAVGKILALAVSVLPKYVLLAAKITTRLPFSAIYTTSNYGAWLLIFVYIVFAAAYLLRGKDGKTRFIAPVCACIVAFCTVTLVFNDTADASLTVTAIDVGQGQSIAVLQRDSTVLIDCGGINSGENAGKSAGAYLHGEGRERVDLLILTHLHADHANGVEYLLETMEVGAIMLPENGDDAGFADDIISAAADCGTDVSYITEDCRVELGELDFTVFAPLGTADANERGLIVLGDYGDFEFLITGDADMGTERILTRLYELPDIELLVVGHHGSKYSTSDQLLDESTPDTAFISVGTNSYGHPTQETLARLYEHGVDVHRTDEEGNISITVGGKYG